MAAPITPALIRAALAHIPADMPRDEWARVGMAIKSEFPDETGLELFESWSQSIGTSCIAGDVHSTWRSVKPGGGVGIGTLLRLAKNSGFVLQDHQDGPALDPAAQVERSSIRALKQAAYSEARAAAHADAALQAREQWVAASTDGQSTYLDRKGVHAYGVRFASCGGMRSKGSSNTGATWLLVPLRDAEGTLWNLQQIAPALVPERSAEHGLGSRTDKLYLKGARKSGLWHMLGDAAVSPVVLLAEGYATAASLHEATGYPVAVAFDAGNLLPVAKALHALHSQVRLVLCGDDDLATLARTGSNPGREKAIAAASAVGGIAVFPILPQATSASAEPENFDFNDLHQAAGLEIVRQSVDTVLQAHLAASKRLARPPAQPLSRRAIRTAAIEAATAAESVNRDDAPTQPHDPFVVDDDGVWFIGRDRDGNPARPLWLCSPLEVAAQTRQQDGGGWGYLLHFADALACPKKWALPARMLSGDGGEYRAMLLSLGLRIATGAQARYRLTEFIQSRHPGVFAICTDRIGWHRTSQGGKAYVLPHETIGDDAERIVFQSDNPMENTFRVRGDESVWRDRIGKLCTGNTRLVFAVACAFAGPLLEPSDMESGGFHFRGDSSSGKTTALRVAASVFGGPSFMQRWRTTDNALEAIAAHHCDALLILDELAQVEGRVAGECAYMLANEQSKARSTRSGGPRARLHWRLLFLSAGELGLSEHMAEGMKRTRVGQEVRMADIPADAQAGLGAFDTIDDFANGAAFARYLSAEAAKCHGAVGRAFLEWLCTDTAVIGRRARTRIAEVAKLWVPSGASGQAERVGARFALVGVAGELATEIGLTGWPRGESERCARACFDAWLLARGGLGNGEERAMVRQAKRFLELHGEGRFTWWHRSADDHNAKTLHRAGVRRLVGQDGKVVKTDAEHQREYGERMSASEGETVSVEYFVLSEVFTVEVCQGFDAHAVCRVLQARGCLLTSEPGRFSVKTRLPGIGHARCYRISAAIFELEG